MKIMFLDESGDHSLDKIDSSYPIFVLAGCIFDFDQYRKIVEPAINELKQEYFGTTQVILRSYDIRKQKGEFACLVDKHKRDRFYAALNKCMESLKYTIIAGAINKSRLKLQYTQPNNPYHICFRFVLERAIMYLGNSGEQMMLRIESRETHNDKVLAGEYETFREGDDKFSVKEIHSKLTDLSFNQKTQNIIGMQIADLVAYPIGKWVMDSKKNNPAFEIIEDKLHKKNGKYIGYGLKIFP